MTTRYAEFTDLPSIVEIYNSTVASRMVTADTKEITVESREKWFYDHKPDCSPIWVVEEGQKIIAWLSFQPFHSRPAYKATAEISIYVHREFRNKGLGKFLLAKAIEEGPKLGVKTILGFIFGHNLPSLNLFQAFGFEQWGHFPGVAELDGVERDLVIMGRKVS